ncbi:hypothetical protein GOP47_0027119 [Adiantum capillus-veneris]|nr:hypothetical protein GOP47_0027119 [Adiantum capillus-veneris]
MESAGGKCPDDGASHGNKVLRLSGVVMEAIQEDMVRPHWLESFLRRLVEEEVNRKVSEFTTQWRLPQGHIITGSTAVKVSRQFHLQFISSPAAESTFTRTKLEGECGDTIRVRLVDVTTRQLVTEGPESATELEVVPLMGDFNIPDEEDWTADEFERNVAKEREGKALQLLAGQLKVYLKGGLGTLGHVYFTDNSSWTRSRKFRLGVRVPQLDNGAALASIREGISQAFLVKENRGKGYSKHDIPKQSDKVWRLRHIARNGPSHQNLCRNGIHTVKDFLCWVHKRPEDLKEVLGKMPAKSYEAAVAHAKKCVPLGGMYVCPVNQPPFEQVVFNQDYQTVGAVADGQYVGLDMLKEHSEKVQMDACLKIVYNNWGAANVAGCMVQVDAGNAEEEPVDMEPITDETAVDPLARDVVQDVEPGSPDMQEPADDNWIEMATAKPPNSNDLSTTDSWWKYIDNARAHMVIIRIRAAVRWALFIRNATFMQQQQTASSHDYPINAELLDYS